MTIALCVTITLCVSIARCVTIAWCVASHLLVAGASRLKRAFGARSGKKIQLAVRVESAFLGNIADSVEYSGQGGI